MRRVWNGLGAGVIVGSVLFVSCTVAPSSSDLAVCFFETPGFSYLEGGEIIGLEPDLLRAWADAAGTQLSFTKVDEFTDLFSLTLEGECDVVAGAMTITEERLREFDFSRGYFDNYLGFVAGENFPALDDSPAVALSGKKVAAFGATTYEGTLIALQEEQRDSGLSLLEIVYAPQGASDDEELLTMVANGLVDGTPLDTGLAIFLLDREPYRKLKIVGFLSEKQEYGFLLPKGSENTASLSGFLDRLPEEQRNELLRTHFGDIGEVFADPNPDQ